jgi:hypothetical protein
LLLLKRERTQSSKLVPKVVKLAGEKLGRKRNRSERKAKNTMTRVASDPRDG